MSKSRVNQLRFNAALLLGALIIVGLAIVTALKLADRLVRPVGQLVTAAGRIEEGDFSARVPVTKTEDEVQTLATAFNRMAGRLDEQTGALVATLPIDTTVVPLVTSGDQRPVTGPAELNQRILESGKVEACLSANYFRYALRRDPTANGADACTFDAMRSNLGAGAGGGPLADTFRKLAVDASFRRRKVGAQ